MTDGVFWNLTPRLLDKLSDRRRQREREKDVRAGTVAAVIMNVNRGKPTDKVWSALDFFPEDATPKRAQTEDEMMRAMDAWVARTARTKGKAN